MALPIPPTSQLWFSCRHSWRGCEGQLSWKALKWLLWSCHTSVTEMCLLSKETSTGTSIGSSDQAAAGLDSGAPRDRVLIPKPLQGYLLLTSLPVSLPSSAIDPSLFVPVPIFQSPTHPHQPPSMIQRKKQRPREVNGTSGHCPHRVPESPCIIFIVKTKPHSQRAQPM
jgi:hypothetical protein